MESGPKTQNEEGVNTNTEWDSLSNFAGENNINSATGKKRNFTQFDVYPRQKGETNEEYGERLKKMHEATEKFQKDYAERKAKDDYQKSEQGKMEAAITAKFDNLIDKLDQAVREGKISAEHAEQLSENELNRSIEAISGVKQDYKDRQAVGDPEEEARYRAWLEGKDVENLSNPKKRGQEYTIVDDNYNIINDKDQGNKTTPEGKTPPDGKNPEDNKGNKVNIDIQIKGIEQEFEEDKKERLKELEDRLKDLKPDLAELYARNRRLFVGSENRAQFNKVRGEYSKLMDEYLKLKAGENYEEGKHEIANKLENKIGELTKEIEEKITEFCGGDLEHSTKTQEEVDAEKAKLVEEAEKKLRETYGTLSGELKDAINADFIDSYVKEQSDIEKATTNALDNGSLCRKFVNKVLNNKKLKIALGVAAGVGLVVTGGMLAAGLAAGTMAVGLSFTAGGVAAGAAKGAFGGALMSRQNSKNSAVRGFSNEEEIRKQLEGIDITDKNSDEANVASYLMEQYEGANDTDRSSNRKKTLISAGIGAVIGGLTSGVQINNIENTLQTSRGITGYKPTEVHATNLDNVNIPKGHGAWDTFQQLGGRPEDFNKFQDIMFKIDPKYGLQPGSNGATPGVNGIVGKLAHTYPGRIDSWPDVAQSYITEVTDEAARQGLIPSIKTGGEAIYGAITKIVTNEVPNAFMNFLTRATANIGVVGTIGGRISNSTTMRHESGETPVVEGGSGGETPPEGETPATEGGEREVPPAEGETPQEVETPPAEGGEGENEANERLRDELEFRQRVADELGSSVGLEGIDIVTAADDFDINGQSVFNARAESWWNNLNDEAKEVVRNFERTLDDSEREDNLLKSWLSNRDEL